MLAYDVRCNFLDMTDLLEIYLLIHDVDIYMRYA